ncbi:MAG TPA: Gfo/Idh/MocA family oxidoreductase [Candidatus Limnocylindrales bacterium]|nr:Gfo/Idh/MocA family oxidoreductase [Candidatus Limnocylindrales bacterium]
MARPVTLRIALFGLGRVAERIHLPACAVLTGGRVIAACDPDPERRRQVGGRFGLTRLYPDAAALLRAEPVDLVVVGTPPETHRDLCLSAIEHGAHVLCEKPLCGTAADAARVIAAAEAKGRLLAVNNQYRFMDLYRVPRERIAAGEFGRLYSIQCWQQMLHPPSREQNWRATLERYTFLEFGTHALDLICFLLDAFPLSIAAHMPIVRPDERARDIVVQATLRFPDERLATLALNRVSHAPERYFEMRLDCERASLRISLGGVGRVSADWSRRLGRPTARFGLARGGEARVEAGGRSRVLVREPKDPYVSATTRHLEVLTERLRAGGRDARAARGAGDLLRIVEAGYESARTGETVWLAPPSSVDA